MKKIRIYILMISAFLWLFAGTSTHADFSGFVEQLLNMNIPINKILSDSGINRYEITRLLNAVECKDCITPNTDYTSRYTNRFWQDFSNIPGNNFDDILYRKAEYNKKSYYYCVAYVGDQEYMNGYPRATSPVCAGEFCGTRYATKAEFLQIIMNMISQYLYHMYALNWNDVQNRVDDLYTRNYAYKNLTETDISTIETRAKECWKQSCFLQNSEELNIYLKYCMFNLKECGMIPFEKIKEWYWPVAELNILYRQQMISLDDAVKYNVGDLIDGKLAVEILSRMNNMVGCAFNNDYDCDGIINSQDSCPNAYNPQQRDFDKDGIGDPCDDDVDNDGIKNPIGIVDDNGNINIALWTQNMDNCLFIVNQDQSDTDGDFIGDACVDSAAKLSLSIAIQDIQWSLPKTVTFGALSKWPVASLEWDFGDGSKGSWSPVSHTYITPWLYTVRLIAKGDEANDAYAKTTVIVGRDTNEKQWLSLLNTSLIIPVGWIGNFSLSSLGKQSYYKWTIDWIDITTDSPLLKKKFTQPGTYHVSVKALDNKKDIVAATLFSVGIGDSYYGSMLIPSTIYPEKYDTINFETKFSNFFSSDISRIIWDFGDGTKKETTAPNTSHSYQSVGKKVILQTIFLRDGTKLQNMVTLFVNSDNLFSSYSIQLLPSSLDLTTFEAFSFKVVPLGDSFSDMLFANLVVGDGYSKVYTLGNRVSFPLDTTYMYKNPGIYYPQTTVSLDQCSQLSAQATLAVWGRDFCLQAKIDWSLLNYACDMDLDSIPDICDTDIDGDGIPNLLGTINPSNSKNCSYIKTLERDNQTLINTELLKDHFNNICSLDNAPYTPNTQQLDLNNNGIGDAMEDWFDKESVAWFAPILDSDNDGIEDSEDLCPLIPEKQNWITDYDWCPEIGLESFCDNSWSPLWQGNFDDIIGWFAGWWAGGDWWADSDWWADGDWWDDIIGWWLPWWWVNCWNGEQNIGETCLNCPEDMESCLFITTPPCLQCPCPFVDIDSDLTNNDIVKAVLRNNQKKYPRGYSLWFSIDY